MLWEGPHRGGDYYRLGIFADKVGDETYYWHSGFWGTIAYYSPRTGLAAAGIVTDQTGSKQLRHIVGEAVGIPAGQVPPIDLER
jgi:D-alanyl-D-alanine carboxypeptidase